MTPHFISQSSSALSTISGITSKVFRYCPPAASAPARMSSCPILIMIVALAVLTGLTPSRIPGLTPTMIPSPTILDSDGDGFADTYETRWGSDPHDPQSVPMALDLDGDGRLTVKDALIYYRNRIGLIPVVPLSQTETPAPTMTAAPSITPTPTAPPTTGTLTPAPTMTAAPSITPTPTAPPTTGTLVTLTLPGGVTMVLMRIPAGNFQMGSNDGSDWSWDPTVEKPVHTVTFSQAFYMGKFEVTQAQWLAVMGNNPSYFQPPSYSEDLSRPVEQVSWDDIAGTNGFIEKLNLHLSTSGQGQYTVRLPSEAEWEYSCRAGSTGRFCFGDSNCAAWDCRDCNLSEYAWWCGNARSVTHAAGGKRANAFGLCDMHGNVFEWCQDWWHSDYTAAPSDVSAWVSPVASDRVIRGGDWNYDARYCRSAFRIYNTPDDRHTDVGFRLAAVQ